MTGDAATVLVVEDSRVNRLALARGVVNEGHRVLEAADGKGALEILADEHVDMVLLDLMMPEVDGYAVLDAMGRDAALRDIPVLVISATEEAADVARAIEMGAIDVLPKPFDPVLLRVRLRTALQRTRLRRLEQDYLRQELALRQQERLATLGRLSAGLGHELNNPAAAALSSARQLQRAIEVAEELLPRLIAHPEVAAVTPWDETEASAGMADAIEDVLAGLGIDEPWQYAEQLARAGATPEELSAWLEPLGEGAALAVAHQRTRAEIRRTLRDLTASVDRIAELTSAMRGYTYMDRAPQQAVDVRRGLDDTLTILSHKRPDTVTVTREYADDLPAIDAFGGQLNQVWTNLLDNAIDALGAHGAITVRARRAGDGVLIEVEDDGPGIPDAVRSQVFDPFVTTKPPGRGTGLGLSIAHHIVADTHGGRLSVESEPGRTVFRVELSAHTAPRLAEGE